MARVSQGRRAERAGAAVVAAADAWLDRAGAGGLDPSRPTPLPGWDVGVLVAHVAHVVDDLVTLLDAPTREAPLSSSDYLRRYADAAPEVDVREREAAARLGLDGSVSRLRDAVSRLRARLEQPVAERLAGRRGPLRSADLLAGRALDLVVHADDLDRALDGPSPELPGDMPRTAVQVAVRCATDALGERYPGHTIEVRVPPYAAVQCGIPGDGPTHTRGTPPNVVETDATTFLRLATGRVTWADAVTGRTIAASGNRADLSGMLPLW